MSSFTNAVNAEDQGVQYIDTSGSWSGLDGGTSGHVLTSNGTGVPPSFQAAAGGASLSPYIVGPTNSDYTTIQAAINAAHAVPATAAAPLNIYIKPGTYTENLTLYDGINLIGLDDSIFYGKQGISSTVKPTAKVSGTISCDNGCTYTKLQNISVSAAAAFSLITQNCNSDFTFEIINCYLENSTANKYILYPPNANNITIVVNNSYLNSPVLSFLNVSAKFIFMDSTIFGFAANQVSTTVYSTDCNYYGGSFNSFGAATVLYSYNDYISSTCTNAGSTQTLNLYGSFINGGIATLINSQTGVTVNAFNCTDGTNQIANKPRYETGIPGVSVSNKNYVTIDTSTGQMGSDAGPSGGGWVLIQRQSASNSTELDFTTGISSTYNNYVMVVDSYLPNNSATTLLLQISTDGGSTYVSTGNDSGANSSSTSSATFVNTNSASGVILIPSISNGNDVGGCTTYLYNMTSPGGQNASASGQYNGFVTVVNGGSGGMATGISSTYINNSATAINALRVISSSGNMAQGNFALYGISQ